MINVLLRALAGTVVVVVITWSLAASSQTPPSSIGAAGESCVVPRKANDGQLEVNNTCSHPVLLLMRSDVCQRFPIAQGAKTVFAINARRRLDAGTLVGVCRTDAVRKPDTEMTCACPAGSQQIAHPELSSP